MPSENVIIFTGAGASFGSVAVLPYPPPLGSSLYSELESFEPNMMSKISSIVGSKNKDDFEKKMHEAMESQQINGIVLNAMIARYFSQFQPMSDGNAYVELFRNLFQEDISFVYSTLNYDCIAELAASQVGMQVSYDLDKMPTNGFDVLKLHGSCNFLLQGISGTLGSISMPVGGAGIDGTIEIVQPRQVSSIIQNRPAGPCMSYYMKNKPTAVGTRTIQAIQKKWSEMIHDYDIIIIIGANVNSGDSHIWDPFSKTNAKIGFVGSKNAFSNLQSLNSKIKGTHISTDFSNSISDIVNFVK